MSLAFFATSTTSFAYCCFLLGIALVLMALNYYAPYIYESEESFFEKETMMYKRKAAFCFQLGLWFCWMGLLLIFARNMANLLLT